MFKWLAKINGRTLPPDEVLLQALKNLATLVGFLDFLDLDIRKKGGMNEKESREGGRERGG